MSNDNLFALLYSCSPEDYSVVFINGILSSQSEAEKSKDSLKDKFDLLSQNKSNANFITGYNPSHVAGFGDVVQAASQLLFSPISEFDKKTILMKIHPEVKTQKILLIGHSQGTFYTNEIYDYFIQNGLPRESVGVYNIATPASLVAGNGGYLTSSNDTMIDVIRALAIKNKVPEPLPANINIPLTDLSALAPKRGHSLTTEYLANAPVKIISDIDKALNKLKASDKNMAIEGCFNSPEKSFGYNLEKGAFALLDSTANGLVTQAKVARAVYLETGKIAFQGLHPLIKNFLTEAALHLSRSNTETKDQGGAALLSFVQNTELPTPTPSFSDSVLSVAPTVITSNTTPTPVAAPTPEPTSAPPELLQESVTPLPPPPAPEDGGEESSAPSPESTPTYQPGFGGGGGGGGAVFADVTAPDKVVITSPSDFSSPFSTSTITFLGTAENGATVSTDFSEATATSSDGIWSLELTFQQGTTTLTFYTEDSSGNRGIYGRIVEVGVNAFISTPTITSPSSFASAFATSTIVFEGTSEPGAVVSQDFSSTTATTTENGTWSLSLSNLPEGDTTTSFYATNGSLVSSANTINLSIDTIAPALTSFVVLECQYSLSPLKCLSGTETINLKYSANSTSPITYSIYRNGALQKTTTDNQTTLSVPDGINSDIVVVAVDGAGNTATSSAVEVNISKLPIVINEIAWAGTQADSSDEWIELYNRTELSLDLSHVALVSLDGVPGLTLSGIIDARNSSNNGWFGHYLIERTASTTTSVTENAVAAFSGDGPGSGLSNTHEQLSLIHYMGGLATSTLDSTPAPSQCGGSWCAGLASTSPLSMERIDQNIVGTLSTNWTTNDTVTRNGTDVDGNNINGTPGAVNSATVNNNPIGYYCQPKDASFFSGQYYSPTDGGLVDGLCTYISYSVSGKRHGYVFKGTVGNSTTLFGHFLNLSKDKTEQGDDYEGNSVVQGDSVFTAIFEVRTGPAFNDLNDFIGYFTTGSPSAPHSNYGILEWKYGVTP